MKNLFLFVFLFCLSSTIKAQDTKPPKIRYTSDFFGNRFEIGDKDAKPTDVLLHLEKHSPQGYFFFRKGKNQETVSRYFLVVSGAALCWGLLDKNKVNKSVAYTIAPITALVCLSLDLGSKNKYRKGVDTFNKQFGY